ncbi:MAG: signal peptidase II [Desulfobacterales bacterium]|jgi:signal peptidase II|nr:signal peptidase II [Desulfobacterales bacterium]
MTAAKLKFLALVAGGVLVLDQLTKAWVLKHLALGASLTLIPGFFDLTHVHNPGGAFGFLATMGPVVRAIVFIAASALAAGVILWLYLQTPTRQRLAAFGLALVFGGALGNLIDRIRFGVVIDFFDVYIGRMHWPAFNVADSAITVGVCIFAAHLIFAKPSA